MYDLADVLPDAELDPGTNVLVAGPPLTGKRRIAFDILANGANRVLLHSVSTLLMYSDLQTVFRFLHVFTGRIQSADALGVYVIDSTAHDDQTMNTLKQLFDAVIELEEAADGEDPTIRTAGFST